MKLRYKASLMWFVMGMIWLGISTYLFFRYLPTSSEEFVLIRMISLVALPAAVAIYYFLMPLITYAKITQDQITIHKSIVIFKFKIDRNNLLFCRTLNRDLVFYTKDDKVFSIHMDWVKKEALIGFIQYLQTFVDVFEENTKTKVSFDHL